MSRHLLNDPADPVDPADGTPPVSPLRRLPQVGDRIARGLDTALDRTIAPGYSRLGLAVRRRLGSWPADPTHDALRGRVALVTGASSGLGTATAEGLARLGARVLLVVRDTDKGEGVRAEIAGRLPEADLRVVRCDVGDLDDVRRFAAELDESLGDDAIDVIVHNAGVMPPEHTRSAQGRELSMAVHVLGPVLMTDLLRERLDASVGGGRVLFVTSGGMYAQRLRADDPDYDEHAGSKGYSPTTAYARSKRAQVELLGHLAARWPDVAVGAMHPGWADTPGVVDSLPGFHKVVGPLLRDLDGGADTAVWWTAIQPPPPSGRLWHDRRERPVALTAKTRSHADDRETLWRWVQRTAGLPD